MNTQIQNLKNEIKISAAKTRELRDQARECGGQEAGRLRHASRDAMQRYRYLAYGYLRGRTYREVENNSATWPEAERVAEIAGVPVEVIDHWIKDGNVRRPWPKPEAREEVA